MANPADNLIAVMIPARPDLKRDLTVPVYVGNRKGKQRFMAQHIPSWTYVVEKPTVISNTHPNDSNPVREGKE